VRVDLNVLLQIQEGTRRYERRRAIRAAVAAAHSFQQQHPGRVVHAFSGICLSHAEGLDVVAPAGGSVAKEQQLMVAQAMIPSLCTGEEESGNYSRGWSRVILCTSDTWHVC
jgi:hypothetical protein